MDSIDSNDDVELMAALIDGRLSGEERARAMKLLAESDDALELFASTLRHQQDVPDVKVVPISTARRWRSWKVLTPIAVAAGLATVIVPRVIGSGATGVLADVYAMELTENPRFSGGLPTGWEERGWAVTRGDASSREAPGTRAVGSPMESRLAFRLGVRSVDLQIALRRSDTVLAKRFINEATSALQSVGFSELVAARYTDLMSHLSTDTRAQSIDRASAAERELRDLLGPSAFAFGEWVGAADLAAETHDASFFQSSHGTSFIRSASPAGSLAGDDIDALQKIDTLVKQGLGDGALDEIHGVLQMIIRRRGG